MSQQQVTTQLARIMSDDLEAELQAQLEGVDMPNCWRKYPRTLRRAKWFAARSSILRTTASWLTSATRVRASSKRANSARFLMLPLVKAMISTLKNPKTKWALRSCQNQGGRIKNWEHVQEVYNNDGVIEGVITRRVKAV